MAIGPVQLIMLGFSHPEFFGEITNELERLRDSDTVRVIDALEVRWIYPGQVDPAVAGWFQRFPAGVESREDTYLVNPSLHRLSVKVRGGGALEVKMYRGNPGILDVPDRARGRIESWRKWSFPCDPPGQCGADLASWMPVHKRISRFCEANGQIRAGPAEPGGEPMCMVELTEVHKPGEAWWTLGFEATGPADLQRGELEATAALVFAEALPDGMGLDTGASRSYAEWLGQQLGAENDAGP